MAGVELVFRSGLRSRDYVSRQALRARQRAGSGSESVRPLGNCSYALAFGLKFRSFWVPLRTGTAESLPRLTSSPLPATG